MSPKVSVIMPVRNGEPWLAAAVESVLAQSFTDFELLAIDDDSTDRTPELLSGFSARDARVQVLQPPTPGLVSALNAAIAVARGDYLARLDADDLALPGRLARQVAVMEREPRLGLLGSHAEIVDEADRPVGRLTPETDSARLKILLARTNPFVHSSLMLRTALVDRLGGYRAAFEAAEDHDLWLRIAEVAEVANLPEILIRYRRHPGNVTTRKEVRQCFSVRLARRAAHARRAGEIDPANGLSAPPDWNDPACERSFFAEDARLYRLLALADPEAASAVAGAPRAGVFFDSPPIGLAPLEAPPTPLSHRERRLAQRALFALMRNPKLRRRVTGRPGKLRLLRLAVALHPARALALGWKAVRGR